MEIDDQLAKELVKWIFIVFIAGFIGQFGKSLTKHMLEWIRKKKQKPAVHPKHTKKDKKLSKLEKKRQKAEIKRRKKGK